MNIHEVETPCYVVDEDKLIENLKVLSDIHEKTGAKILLAQKAFSMYSLYPLIGKYLSGTTASGLFEARLGFEEMKEGEVHVYAPAFKEEELKAILSICDHLVLNTPDQIVSFQDIIHQYKKDNLSIGLRINPEYSEIETEIYNPCFPGSRLGTRLEVLEKAIQEGKIHFGKEGGIEGLHFHTMCEQGADVLERTLTVVEEKFGKYFEKIKWINFGGGHHITRKDYDVERLMKNILRIKENYGLEIYLEPGEAVALNAGYLVATVLDTLENKSNIAILDTSATCHMPDVLEMPYRPEVIGAGKPGEKPFTYRLTSPTCLAGDVIGDYSFDRPLQSGDKLIFCDMAIYTMVKNNTFNGMPLPSIARMKHGEVSVVKTFGYKDFKERLS